MWKILDKKKTESLGTSGESNFALSSDRTDPSVLRPLQRAAWSLRFRPNSELTVLKWTTEILRSVQVEDRDFLSAGSVSALQSFFAIVSAYVISAVSL